MSSEVDEKDVGTNSSVPDDNVEELGAADAKEELIADDLQATDNVGDVSVEINVEELIADIEGENDEDATRKKEIRRRLEELAEEKSFEDTYAIDLGDEEE